MARPREAHAQAAAGDVTTLTALQRAEYDAIRTYSTAESILMTDLSSDPQASTVRAVAAYYRGQHEAHANALRTAITAAGGTPIDPTTVFFMPPTGFRATVANIIKLAANKEKAAAVAYAEAVRSLGTAERAQLAAAIGGVETQHWIVLYLLAKGVVQPGMNAATMLNQLCPQAFVASVGTGTAGLEAVAEYQYAPNAT
ncbi:MAG: ferritin-like domain-containing protein [Myxococcales bacterium]|nr:ferritin-like domain-containing protein [Myxococcales bacterium]